MSVTDRLPQFGLLDGYTRAERGVLAFVVGLLLLLTYGLVTGGLGPTYFLYLIGLVGMYVLLSFGLNAQWGYTGLINFSVAAFFGIGAYGTALLSADSSPIAGDMLPVVGLFVGLLVAAIVAVIIGVPTLRLRTDYLAIASLGLAEVVRIVVQNQTPWTNGSAGLRGIPGFFEGWPVLETFPQAMPTLVVERLTLTVPFLFEIGLFGFRLGTSFWQGLLNVSLVLVFVGVTYALLRRVHRSPWGRVLRTIRADEDLAEALGKDTYAFKMQSFVLGSIIMALAGVFYAHLNLYVSPGDFEPINTFYVWIAVILGGSGSNRGAMFGGFVVIAIREGTRFLGDLLPAAFPTLGVPFTDLVVSFPALVESTYATVVSNFASTRLLAVGLVIILVMRFRPEGVLPPQRELIWPEATEGSDTGSDRGAQAVSADGSGERPGGSRTGDTDE